MRPRPPTMRNKRRYLLARVDPPSSQVDPRDLYYAFAESVSSLFGDEACARVQPAVLYCDGGYAIIRCTRGTERTLLAAAAAVTEAGGLRIALRSVAVSGTILALRKRIAGLPGRCTGCSGTMEFGGRTYTTYRYGGQKVDLMENGIKSQESLFLTNEDLEEL